MVSVQQIQYPQSENSILWTVAKPLIQHHLSCQSSSRLNLSNFLPNNLLSLFFSPSLCCRIVPVWRTIWKQYIAEYDISPRPFLALRTSYYMPCARWLLDQLV